MSKIDKLLKRFLGGPKDFTYDELKKMLAALGYEIVQTGKTAGSRAAFICQGTGHIIRLHKPHPQNELKAYQMEFIEEELRKVGLIK